jgi:hypothetical protein
LERRDFVALRPEQRVPQCAEVVRVELSLPERTRGPRPQSISRVIKLGGRGMARAARGLSPESSRTHRRRRPHKECDATTTGCEGSRAPHPERSEPGRQSLKKKRTVCFSRQASQTTTKNCHTTKEIKFSDTCVNCVIWPRRLFGTTGFRSVHRWTTGGWWRRRRSRLNHAR